MSLPDSKPRPFILYGALLVSLLIWSGTSVIGKLTVGHFPVFLILFLRFLGASVLILPLLARDRAKLRRPKLGHYVFLFCVCLFGFTFQIGLFFLGIVRTSILDMSIITMLSPVLVSLAGWLVFKEPHRLRNYLGLALAGFGATLGITTASVTNHHSLIGDLLLIGSEISVAFYAVGSKKLSEYFSPLVLAASSFSVAMLSFGAYALLDPSSPEHMARFNASIWWGLAYLAVLSSVIAYVFYEWTLQHLAASTVAALSYLQPMASAALGMIFLGEMLSWGYIAGVGITFVGIWLALSHPAMKGKMAHHVLHTKHRAHR